MTDIQKLVEAYIKREFNLSLDDLHKISQEKALQEIADFGQEQDKCAHEYDHNGECLKCDEPMSEWVPMTDEEIHDIVYEQVAGYIVQPNPSLGFRVAANIEAKLKEKNT